MMAMGRCREKKWSGWSVGCEPVAVGPVEVRAMRPKAAVVRGGICRDDRKRRNDLRSLLNPTGDVAAKCRTTSPRGDRQAAQSLAGGKREVRVAQVDRAVGWH